MLFGGYAKAGIQHVNYPVDISSEQEFAVTTFTGAQYLAELLEQSENGSVLVHCKSGIVRSPTLVLAYLCLYKRVRGWQSVPEASDALQSSLHGANWPNRHLVAKILGDNGSFQAKQRENWEVSKKVLDDSDSDDYNEKSK